MTSTLITLADAAALLPKRRDGKNVSTRTLSRWIDRGCYGTKLQAERIGRDWYTCALWLQQFIDASSNRGPDKPTEPTFRARLAQTEFMRRFGTNKAARLRA